MCTPIEDFLREIEPEIYTDASASYVRYPDLGGQRRRIPLLLHRHVQDGCDHLGQCNAMECTS